MFQGQPSRLPYIPYQLLNSDFGHYSPCLLFSYFAALSIIRIFQQVSVVTNFVAMPWLPSIQTCLWFFLVVIQLVKVNFKAHLFHSDESPVSDF